MAIFRQVSKHGYVRLWRRLPCGREISESRFVVEQVIGKKLDRKHIVHHIDGNSENNKNDNLIVLENRREHAIVHAKMRIVEAGGNPSTQAFCSRCGKIKSKEMFTTDSHRWNRKSLFCRPCENERLKKYRSM